VILKDKVALVTGAASGIGRAIALRFSNEGASIIIADANGKAAQETLSLIQSGGGSAEVVIFDVGSPEAVAEAYECVKKKFRRIDIQVSNAGITDRMMFLDMPLKGFERILRTNLYGTLMCGQAAARLMKDSGGGRIVNMTSISGQQGGTGRAAYGATKAAIINLTQTMAMELAEFNILVNAIAPGPTQVARTAHGPAQRKAFLDRMAIQRYAKPEDIAGAALFLCSEDASFITGQVINVDGGFSAAGVLYNPTGER